MYISFEYIAIFVALLIGVPILWLYSDKDRTLFILSLLYCITGYLAISRYGVAGLWFTLALSFVAIILFVIALFWKK